MRQSVTASESCCWNNWMTGAEFVFIPSQRYHYSWFELPIVTIEKFYAKTKKVTQLALAFFSTIRFSTAECIIQTKIVAIGAKIMKFWKKNKHRTSYMCCISRFSWLITVEQRRFSNVISNLVDLVTFWLSIKLEFLDVLHTQKRYTNNYCSFDAIAVANISATEQSITKHVSLRCIWQCITSEWAFV